jgi:hypothetical protein
LDASWPVEHLMGEYIEIGNADHKTSYMITAAKLEKGQTVLTLDKAADLSYAHVTGTALPKKQVGVSVAPTALNQPGMNNGLTCTNDDMTRNWSCRFIGGVDDAQMKTVYQLKGMVTEKDFPVGSVLRIWEYGVGDDVRLAARATVRRGADGKYSVTSNAKATWTK